ncbi:MAG TPA: ATPase, T2SS/T4P/T4SS family [bacterium]|jgi:type IV pilus assembly protein PilB
MTPVDQKREKIGQILIRAGAITQEELERGLEIQHSNPDDKIGAILVRQGYCTKDDVALAYEKQTGIKFLNLARYEYTPELEALISPENMNRLMVLPIKVVDDALEVAMGDPLDFVLRENLRMMTGMKIIPFIAHEDQIREIIFQKVGKKYVTDDYIDEAMKYYQEEDEAINLSKSLQSEGMDAVNAGPVVRLVTTIVTEAVESGASDIHVEPNEDEVVVRYRIDGILHKIMTIPSKIKNPTISRLKILAQLDIAERRKPQDGRMSAKISGRELDFRVSCLPTVFGEKLVLRILDKNNAMVGLEKLGLEDHDDKFVREMAQSPWGIMLVSGPTGSGKSTTLYSILNMLNDSKVNIVTIEDPVEYTLPGINQVEVNVKAGLNFAAALRSFLRQDPDIILVGEIRDQETLSAAVEASLTGHLVFTTLHTNDAPSSIVRMVQMGAPNYLVAASAIGVLAQRLVRTICSVCKEPVPIDEEFRATFERYFPKDMVTLNPDEILAKARMFKGRGCTICRGTGYKGRQGIFESMRVSPKVRELILVDASTDEIRKAAIKEGMITLEQAALMKVLRGATTLDEATRITTMRKEEEPVYDTGRLLDEVPDGAEIPTAPGNGHLDEMPEENLLDEASPEMLDEEL